jgi:hypothetical protein
MTEKLDYVCTVGVLYRLVSDSIVSGILLQTMLESPRSHSS